MYFGFINKSNFKMYWILAFVDQTNKYLIGNPNTFNNYIISNKYKIHILK